MITSLLTSDSLQRATSLFSLPPLLLPSLSPLLLSHPSLPSLSPIPLSHPSLPLPSLSPIPLSHPSFLSSQAANPGCLLEDFVRWYSPRDWIEDTGEEADTLKPLQARETTASCGTVDHETRMAVTTSLEEGKPLEDTAKQKIGGSLEQGGVEVGDGDGVEGAVSEAVVGEGWGEVWDEDWDFVGGDEEEGRGRIESREEKESQIVQELQTMVSKGTKQAFREFCCALNGSDSFPSLSLLASPSPSFPFLSSLYPSHTVCTRSSQCSYATAKQCLGRSVARCHAPCCLQTKTSL